MSKLNSTCRNSCSSASTARLFAADLDPQFLFFDVQAEGADDFVGGGGQGHARAADLARAGVVDEFGQLGGDLVGFVHDGPGFLAHLGRGLGQARKHLRLAADDVQGIARLVRQAGGGQVQFLEMRIQLAGAHQADLQFRRAADIAPRQAGAERGNAGEKADDEAQPQVGVQTAR